MKPATLESLTVNAQAHAFVLRLLCACLAPDVRTQLLSAVDRFREAALFDSMSDEEAAILEETAREIITGPPPRT